MLHINEPTKGRGTHEPLLLDLVLKGEDTIIPVIQTASALGRSDHYIINMINCSPDYDPVSKILYMYIYIYDKGIDVIQNIDWEAEFPNH